MMNRRTLLCGLILGTLSLPRVAEAQPAGRTPLLAVLEPGSAERPSPALRWFWHGLRERGWQGGRNVTIEIRYADWKVDRLPGLLAELARLHPEVLYTHSSAAAMAVKQTIMPVPVVIGMAGDLVGMGVVASLARPGGNITGMTSISPQLDPKRLELLREVVPKMARVGVLGYVANPPPRMIEDAARTIGVQLRRAVVREPAEIDGAFETMVRTSADTVLIEDSALLATNRDRIAALALKHRLPSMSQIPQFAEAGGLLQYGVDVNDVFRRSAGLVDKVLRGAQPADLPVEQPTKLELVINLKTAKALGLTIPPALLLRADQVIE